MKNLFFLDEDDFFSLRLSIDQINRILVTHISYKTQLDEKVDMFSLFQLSKSYDLSPAELKNIMYTSGRKNNFNFFLEIQDEITCLSFIVDFSREPLLVVGDDQNIIYLLSFGNYNLKIHQKFDKKEIYEKRNHSNFLN